MYNSDSTSKVLGLVPNTNSVPVDKTLRAALGEVTFFASSLCCRRYVRCADLAPDIGRYKPGGLTQHLPDMPSYRQRFSTCVMLVGT